jgi:hypothetical protein
MDLEADAMCLVAGGRYVRALAVLDALEKALMEEGDCVSANTRSPNPYAERFFRSLREKQLEEIWARVEQTRWWADFVQAALDDPKVEQLLDHWAKEIAFGRWQALGQPTLPAAEQDRMYFDALHQARREHLTPRYVVGRARRC